MNLLLHSGGADSQVCWLMRPTLKPVYVRYGAEQEGAELQALRDIQSLDHTFQPAVIKLGFSPVIELDGHVAFRNALLIVAALAAFPTARSITLGALLGEGSGDKSAAFTRYLSRAVSVSEGRPIAIERPLRHWTKAQALRHGLALDRQHTLTVTTSCYHGSNCGKCQSCFRLGIATYLCGFRVAPPPLPSETKGVLETLRANKVRRWPALAVANVDVVRAYGRYGVGRVLTPREERL